MKLPSFFEEEFLVYVQSRAEQRLFKYLDVNHEDNVVMVGIRPIISDLMDKVIEVPPKVLNEKDWWADGFKSLDSGKLYCEDHVDLVAYASELCRKIYRKHHDK